MKHAEKIIRAVRGRPYLYDQTLQTSKYSGLKNKSWMEVAQIVYGRDDKATVNRIKIQWKSLRDAFVKSQRRNQTGSIKLRPYVYEEDMQFLIPHILKKDLSAAPTSFIKTEDSSNFNTTASEDSTAEADLQEEVEEESKVSEIEEYIWDEYEPHEQEQQQEEEREVKKKEERNIGPIETHPVDAFFHGIAQTVKQLKPATVARLKKAVANIVMDAEIDELERRDF